MPCRLFVNDRPTSADLGTLLFDGADAVGVRVPTSCVRQGKCRECLLEIESGMHLLSSRKPQEEHLMEGFRLACLAEVTAEEGVIRCSTMRRGALRIETENRHLSLGRWPLEPAYRRRQGKLLREGEPVGKIDSVPLGLALDLGTTTVALKLFDLESGESVVTHGFENPQRFGGSDVMSRIRYDGDHPGKLLRRVLLGYLTRAIEEMTSRHRDIVEVVVAANPTMRDLLFGLDVSTIGQLPYRSITEHEFRAGERDTTSLRLPARQMRLPLHPAAEVVSLPLISSHVGADAAACLLSTGLAENESVGLLMDIGTNTELIIGNRTRILVTSCPAGPAFEGGVIRCGMPGLEGAIERVRGRDDGTFEIQVIGGGVPSGICGSGLIDLLSEMMRASQMNIQGRFEEDRSETVVHASRNIVLTEADVSELAQAKGAHVAGTRIAVERFGVGFEGVGRFYLAGGFGRHLDVHAAQRIGLIPRMPDERIEQVGNAALAGASMALLSLPARAWLEAKVLDVEHLSLETDPDFFDYFVDGCQFIAVGEAAS